MTDQFFRDKKPPLWRSIGLAILVFFGALVVFPETREFLNPATFLARFIGHAPFKSIRLVINNHALTGTEVFTLVNKLNATFPSSVVLTENDIVLDSAYDSKRAQFDADKVAEIDALFANQQKDEYIVVVVPGDIYAGAYSFLFADTKFSPPRTILSTSRLKVDVGGQEFVNRIYKIFLRRIGQMAALYSNCGPMNFSNSLAELDALPDQYCANDTSALKEKGFARDQAERSLFISQQDGLPDTGHGEAIKIPVSLRTPCEELPAESGCSTTTAFWVNTISVTPEAGLSNYRTIGKFVPRGRDWQLLVLPDTYRINFPPVQVGGMLYLKSATWGEVDLLHHALTVKQETPLEAIKIELARGAMLSGSTTQHGKPEALQVVLKGPGGLNVQMSVSGNRNNPHLPYNFEVMGLAPGDYFICTRTEKTALPASADPTTDSNDACNKTGQNVTLHAGDKKRLNLDLSGDQAEVPEKPEKQSAGENFHITPLMAAAYNNDISAMKKLLNENIDVNAQNDLELTALYYAAGATPLGKVRDDEASYQTVELLLDHGAKPNLPVMTPTVTPLMAAVQNNLPKTVTLLVERGADVNATDNYGTTALMGALVRHQWQMANYLLDKNPNLNGPVDINGYDTLLHAVSAVYPLATLPSVKSVFPGIIPEAAADTADGTTVVERLLREGAKTDHFNNLGQTAFLFAAMKCQNSLVTLFLNHGVDINQKDKTTGETVLINAIRCNNLTMVKELLDHGADKSIKTKTGKTALDYAAQMNSPEIIELLKNSK